MARVMIDPDAVDGTARALHQGATQIDNGGGVARRALWHTDDLPVAFRHKAEALGGQISSTGYYACDALAVSGIELSRRAEIARIVDSGSVGGDAFKPDTPAGARMDLNLWNEATRDAAHAAPGAYFTAIAAALGGTTVTLTADPSKTPKMDRIVKAAGVVTAPGKAKTDAPKKKVDVGLDLDGITTGSTISVKEAISIADTSGTGIAIAFGPKGRLTIGAAS